MWVGQPRIVRMGQGLFACSCSSSNRAFLPNHHSPKVRTTPHLVKPPLQLVKQRGRSVKNQSACIKGPCWLCIGAAYGMSGFPFCIICDSIVEYMYILSFVWTDLKVKKGKQDKEKKASGRNNDVVLPSPMLELRFAVGLPPTSLLTVRWWTYHPFQSKVIPLLSLLRTNNLLYNYLHSLPNYPCLLIPPVLTQFRILENPLSFRNPKWLSLHPQPILH